VGKIVRNKAIFRFFFLLFGIQSLLSTVLATRHRGATRTLLKRPKKRCITECPDSQSDKKR